MLSLKLLDQKQPMLSVSIHKWCMQGQMFLAQPPGALGRGQKLLKACRFSDGVPRTSGGGNGNHSVSLPIILIKI